MSVTSPTTHRNGGATNKPDRWENSDARFAIEARRSRREWWQWGQAVAGASDHSTAAASLRRRCRGEYAAPKEGGFGTRQGAPAQAMRLVCTNLHSQPLTRVRQGQHKGAPGTISSALDGVFATFRSPHLAKGV